MSADSRRTPVRRSLVAWLIGGLVIALGLPLIVGGAWLLGLGGSPYYLAAGAALVVAGAALIWRYPIGVAAYALFLAGTTVWAVWEVGWEGWLLAPRLAGPSLVFGLILLAALRLPRPPAANPPRPHLRSVGALAATFCLFVAAVAGTSSWRSHAAEIQPSLTPAPSSAPVADWTAYGASPRGARFSAAVQITPQNVAALQVAWTYRTGERPDPAKPKKYRFEDTPLKVGGSLYICTPHNRVIALDAETGKERWVFDPKEKPGSGFATSCRGVSYWAAPVGTAAPCARRILTATLDARLIAVDAATGKPCEDFGVGGQVDLKQGMGEVKPDFYYVTSPPTIGRDIAVVGGWVTDNFSTDVPSGVIRGFDVRTGRLVWNFDSGKPDETAPLAAGQVYSRGSPNSWAPATVDEALGLVFLPTGNRSPDYWGGNRSPSAEKFSSSVVALDLATGKLRWVYQTLHHDLWDQDVPDQPTLADIRKDGQAIPALFLPTKRGDIFVLDRRTGVPIFPVTEKPTPQGAAPGDWVSKTQPFSALSFEPKTLREADMWGVSPFDQLWCRIQFKQSRYDGAYTPQGLKPVIFNPGGYGVFNWGGAAVDEGRQLAIVNASYAAFRIQLVPRDDPRGLAGNKPLHGAPFGAIGGPFLSPLGIPCQAPPWGELAAIDLTTAKVIWRQKFGTTRDRAPFGIAAPLGMPSMGGPIMTASGLTFIAAASDNYIRAYAVATGKPLWRARLPAGGQATPMTYVSPASGRQFVVIAAGGHAALGTSTGDYVIAYSLPK
jgi:quinoprotein glucose dehydrogenase